ncbi:hypothetical protein [Bradyrhizobium sp.]|uniref:hypothetical protein n=1 Tax=Bradyrhizobium sp. TaxID=376 RepID=UPI003C394A5E
MSVTNEPEPIGPYDPVHHAPRWRRENQAPRATATNDVQSLRENRPEIAVRSISRSAAPGHAPLRRRPDSQAMSESRGPARKMKPRGTLFSAAGRLIEAIGVLAILALSVAMLMPAVRQPNHAQLFAAALQPFMTVLSQRRQGEDAPRSALAEFQGLPASGGAVQTVGRERPEKDADKILRQFLQYQPTSARERAE